jgi:D-arabinose 1-dehydrogenase-like Zn-dependent alcohol dehydrogenase
MKAAVVSSFDSAPRYQDFGVPAPAGDDEVLVDVLAAGQDVLVLGATGNAGQMAVQVAKRLGAGQIIAAGRDTGRLAALPALGATATNHRTVLVP